MGDILAYVGAYRSTQAANAQAEGQAYTAQANAQIANSNAALEASRRETNLAASRRKFDLAGGSTRSAFALLGFSGGSSLDVLADLSNQSIFEQDSIVKESVGAQTSYKNQAAVYKSTAANLLNSRQSPVLNGGLAVASYDIGLATSLATGGLGGGGLGSTAGTSVTANRNVSNQP